MIVTASILLILVSVWNFGNGMSTTIEIVEVPNTFELLKEAMNIISEKDFLIKNYQNEIINMTLKLNSLEEKLNLTQHSLQMANEVINNFENQGTLDNSSDYE